MKTMVRVTVCYDLESEATKLVRVKAHKRHLKDKVVKVDKEKEKDNDSKKLSKTETVVVVISSILISAGIGFSIYWFILREKEEGEKKV